MQAGAWDRLFDIYVDDSLSLGIREFFEETHPQSLQEMTGVMLETARKGLWAASKDRIEALAELHEELISAHGVGCSGFVCGNPKLKEFIQDNLDAGVAERYAVAIDSAMRDPAAEASLVLKERGKQTESGDKAQTREPQDDKPKVDENPRSGATVVAASIVCLLILVTGSLLLRRRRRRAETA